jgi:hypothetical protein
LIIFSVEQKNVKKRIQKNTHAAKCVQHRQEAREEEAQQAKLEDEEAAGDCAYRGGTQRVWPAVQSTSPKPLPLYFPPF